MRKDFSIGDLEAFVAVADHLSFGMAARVLNVSPSALSRRIKKLETTLDTRLLERSTRDVRLSLAGLQVYSRAQGLIDNSHELLDASAGNALYARRVVVACSYSHSQTFIPPALKRYQALYPKVSVVVRTVRAIDTFDLVKRGIADFGITDTGLQETGLEFVPFCEERIVLATPTGHPLAGRDSLSWRDVPADKLIAVVRGTPVRVLLDFELARAQIRVSAGCEVGNLHAALQCVAAGVGLTATPEHTGSVLAPKIALVPLTDPPILMRRGFVRSLNRPLRPAAQGFWDCLLPE